MALVTAEPVVVSKSCGSRGLMLPLILTGSGDEESGGVSSSAGGGTSDQSTSEDSSLTDSDRTLIGDVQEEYPSDGECQLASPPFEEQPNPLPATESPPAVVDHHVSVSVSSECSTVCSVPCQPCCSDELAAFGLYVAAELRRITDPLTRAMAKHKICDVIFRATISQMRTNNGRSNGMCTD